MSRTAKIGKREIREPPADTAGSGTLSRAPVHGKERGTPGEGRWADDPYDLEALAELEDELDVKVGLIEDEDYAGLVEYLEGAVARRPDDAYARTDLGEAYVVNGEPGRALELLAPLYARAPHFEAVQWVILDALFAGGRDETAFDWVEVPAVVRLDDRTLDACFSDLERRGRPEDVEGLYSRLLCCGYCAFAEDDLLSALRRDGRFTVEVRLCRQAGRRAEP